MRISIITVSYNSAGTIERTIKSVIQQEYGDVEYIVIDGGSTDGTVDVIRKYEKKIFFWLSEPDEGIYDAMNKGIRRATGEIIAFLNSDDWYQKNILSEVAEQFQDNNTQIVCGDVYYHQEGNTTKWHVNEEKVRRQIRFRMGFFHPAMFARKNLFEKYGGFDTKYRITADYDWLLRVYDRHVKIAVIDKVLTNFSDGGVSTKDEIRQLDERMQVSVSAVERNAEMTEKEKAEWRKRIEFQNDNDKYICKMKTILKSRILEKNPAILSRTREVFRQARYSVFGCGAIGRQVAAILNAVDIPVTQIWDNNKKNWGKDIEGIKIRDPAYMDNWKDVVIIASTDYEEEIEAQLIEKGFVRDVHYLRYSDLRRRIVDAVEAG